MGLGGGKGVEGKKGRTFPYLAAGEDGRGAGGVDGLGVGEVDDDHCDSV